MPYPRHPYTLEVNVKLARITLSCLALLMVCVQATPAKASNAPSSCKAKMKFINMTETSQGPVRASKSSFEPGGDGGSVAVYYAGDKAVMETTYCEAAKDTHSGNHKTNDLFGFLGASIATNVMLIVAIVLMRSNNRSPSS